MLKEHTALGVNISFVCGVSVFISSHLDIFTFTRSHCSTHFSPPPPTTTTNPVCCSSVSCRGGGGGLLTIEFSELETQSDMSQITAFTAPGGVILYALGSVVTDDYTGWADLSEILALLL